VKNKRHTTILEIISETKVDTQETLLQELKKKGFSVTQATVSRDVKDLGLVKLKGQDGEYYYAHVNNHVPGSRMERMVQLLRNAVVGVDSVNNLVVVKTLTGSANTAAEAIDSLHNEYIVGSLAGDNTVLIILRNESEVSEFVAKIKQFIS
jgi:transcriptional regulator of arginine metabolism